MLRYGDVRVAGGAGFAIQGLAYQVASLVFRIIVGLHWSGLLLRFPDLVVDILRSYASG
jgi:hypothetical protein